MRFIKPSVPAGSSSSGGYVGSPQSPSWRKEWIENKRRWALLTCGCIIDIVHDRSLLIINAFKGTAIHCDDCGHFAYVVRQMETKDTPTETSQEPLF